MRPNILKHLIIFILFILTIPALAQQESGVIYPNWFKHSFYDLRSDLQEARQAGKTGIMVFFSMKTCSYCQAIIETALREEDIVKRLRKNYDVIGLDVFSDNELVDMQGKSHWTKDFAVLQKAKFTPTLIFYGKNGSVQLRLIGYQSAEKLRAVLDYLEGNHYTRMSLRAFMKLEKSSVTTAAGKTTDLDLNRYNNSDKHLMVIFESDNCSKCRLFRSMLKNERMQPYLQRLTVAFVSSSDEQSRITTPDGRQLSGKLWADQLGLLHSPAVVFFYKQGKEVLRVDTDILIDRHGNPVSADNEHVLDNIRARLQFVVDKGYVDLPQYQRWRAQQRKRDL